MLGLPALNKDEPPEDDIFGLGSGSKSTQFGLPAQSREEVADDDSEPEWEDEFDATSIVPTAQLDAKMAHDAGISGVTGDERDTASGIPGVDAGNQRTGVLPSPATLNPGPEEPDQDDSDRTGVAHPRSFNQAWGLDEDTAGSNTAVASPDSLPADVSGGFAQFVPPQDEDHNVGTLLGMSLEEVEEQEKARAEAQRQDRSTQFALPAAQREPDPVAESSDRTAVADADAMSHAVQSLEEDSEDESPTMAWNPAEDPEFSAKFGGDDIRKSKLEKLRAKKHLLKTDRDTAQGIPSAKKSKKASNGPQKPADPRKQVPRRQPTATPQAQDGQRTSSISAEQLSDLSSKVEPTADTDVAQAPDSSALKKRGLETPSSGVLKVPKRTNPPGSLRAEDTGLLGKSSYSKSREEITSDNPAADGERVPVTDGPVPGAVPTPPKQEASPLDTIPESPALDLPELEPSDVGLEELSWKEEYAYEETGIAPAEVSSEIGAGARAGLDSQPTAKPDLSFPSPSPDRGPAQSPDSAPPVSASPPSPAHPTDPDVPPEEFKASSSSVKPFSVSSTGTKFPTGPKTADASYPAQRNTMDGQLPSSDGFQPQSGSFEAQKQKKGLAGMSPTDLFSNLPDSVNTAPPGVAPPNAPRTGAMTPGEGLQEFDFSAPTPGGHGQQHPPAQQAPNFGQQPQPFGESSGFVPQQAGDDGVTKFVGRAQGAFGVLGGLVLLASLYVQLRPFKIPEQDLLAISLAMTALAGIGSVILSVFPVSPGLRGIAFGFLSIVALGGLGLLMAAGASNIVVVVLLLAGTGLTFVAAVFPVIGKLVS